MNDDAKAPDDAPGWAPFASAGESESAIFGKLMAADADNHRHAADQAAQLAIGLGLRADDAQALRERVLGHLAAFHARQAAEMHADLNPSTRH